ncbi:MAG TPA: DUF2784 domain-containing protein [Casimicrobiaceae bacterium]|nr:DUF2784 domain-containing protein [Casimicrobiaceae bacterium]
MTMRLAADALVLLHFAFIAFVVAGGALALVDRRWAIVHLPAVAWAAWTEFTATVCPLTPWENLLRANAGNEGYSGGFVEHYIVTVIYPQGLTSDTQFALGVAVVVLNAVVYAIVWRRGARPRRKRPPQHMTRGA